MFVNIPNFWYFENLTHLHQMSFTYIIILNQCMNLRLAGIVILMFLYTW